MLPLVINKRNNPTLIVMPLLDHPYFDPDTPKEMCEHVDLNNQSEQRNVIWDVFTRHVTVLENLNYQIVEVSLVIVELN